jgi:hypothetical protein
MYGGEGQSGKKSHKSSLTRVVEETLITGEVEELELQISGAVVLREQGEDVWFLQVEPNQLLCIWDPEEVKDRLSLVWAKQGEETRVLREDWSGEPVRPSGPRRAFRIGEFRPRYGASLLPGTLEDLDATLLRLAPERKATGRPIPQLAHDVEALGFYKFVTADLIDRVKAEYEVGPEEWFSAAGRGFEADGELLYEGGVATLLEVMQPALSREGVKLGAVSETYREEAGLLLSVGEESHTLWSTGETHKLLVERLQGLLDRWLEKAGSKERVFVRGPQLVLLTPELNEKL